MATLIQSKQIQGVVTASVIIGDFQVSGSTNLTGSVGVAGTLTATSLVGEGSGITGISFWNFMVRFIHSHCCSNGNRPSAVKKLYARCSMFSLYGIIFLRFFNSSII